MMKQGFSYSIHQFICRWASNTAWDSSPVFFTASAHQHNTVVAVRKERKKGACSFFLTVADLLVLTVGEIQKQMQ